MELQMHHRCTGLICEALSAAGLGGGVLPEFMVSRFV